MIETYAAIRMQVLSLLLYTTGIHAYALPEINIASFASLTTSSVLKYNNHNYSEYNVYDGHLPDSPSHTDACGCCFSTDREVAPFLEATFHGHFDIQRIVLIARRDDIGASSDLSGIILLLDNIPVNVNLSENNKLATVDTAGSTVKTITIERPNKVGLKWYLMICEMKVFAKAINVAATAVLSSGTLDYRGNLSNTVGNSIIPRGYTNSFIKDRCYSCYSSTSPYFQADFLRPLHAVRIAIEGTTSSFFDTQYGLSNITVYLDNRRVLVTVDTTRNFALVETISPFKVIKIERWHGQDRTTYLTICEISVFVPDCALDFYGNGCEHSCDNCGRSGVCDWNGKCTYGCSVGYYGNSCNETCPGHRYGSNCNQTCHCKNSAKCDKLSGRCPDGCDLGWMGESCSKVCEIGTFGPGCSHICHCENSTDCDRFDGHCPGVCDRGWTGYNCSISCPLGRYGSNCKHQCHCSSSGICDKVSGICSSCAIGWTGLACNTACPNGTFGPGCAYTCHCRNNQACDNVNGKCSNGCDYGWTGQNCSEAHTLQDAITVNCSSTSWDIRVDMASLYIVYPSARASDLYLGDNSCTGKLTSGVMHFQKGLEQCLTSKEMHNGNNVYSNELVYAQHDLIHPFLIRSFNWTVRLECEIENGGTTHGRVINAASSGAVGAGSRNNTVLSKFYKDPNYMTEIRGNPLSVPVGTKVYVKVYTSTADWGVKMRVDNCYTKPAIDAQDFLKVDILKHGCEADINTHLISQTTHETRFVFQQFAYTNSHQGIFLSCDAVFCDVNDFSNRCTQTCHPGS